MIGAWFCIEFDLELRSVACMLRRCYAASRMDCHGGTLTLVERERCMHYWELDTWLHGYRAASIFRGMHAARLLGIGNALPIECVEAHRMSA